ncbi:MAG: hypothetical protein Q7V43_29625 [Myxococcales bacterium]|nr:hypothetical protein [Myxococcales bacterium]
MPPRPRLASSVVLGLALLSGCHGRRARTTRPAGSPRWIVAAADGPAIRVRGGLVLKGALRADNGRVARPPYPASPIAATAWLADGAWLFAAADGTLYRASSFTGALAVVGALPFRLRPIEDDGAMHRRGVHSRGALVVLDDALGAHAVAPDGSHRPLPLGRALSACFASATDLYAVSEPGVLRASHDGGARFAVERAPAGVPLAVWNADDDTFLRTTAGTFRLAGRSFVPDASAPTPAAWLGVPRAVLDGLRDATAALPLRLHPERSAALPRGRVAQIVDGALEIVDGRTGRALARDTLPGNDCALHAAHGGLRAVCRHAAWATLVAARDADRPGWTILRDEARAEPAGTATFDDASAAWAVQAPCAQHPLLDPRDVCLYDARGLPLDVRLPVPATVLAVHAGAALAVEASAEGRAPRMFLLRDGAATELSPPDDLRAPVAAAWTAANLTLAHATAAAPLALSVATAPAGANPAWRRVAVPAHLTRALLAPDGAALLYGADAHALARSRNGDPVVSLPSPVIGAPSALALDPDATSFCVGAWCRLGGALTLAPPPAAPARVLARADDPPAAQPARRPQRTVRCEHGAVSPAPEIDRGAAVSGHAVQWSLAGATLTVTWSGETARASVTGAVTVRPGASATGRGVQGDGGPAALIELCAPSGCDHLLALPTGYTALGLGRAQVGGVEVLRRPGGYVARADDARDGVTLVTLVALDATGAVTARRTYALAAARDEAHVGSWSGRDGLWVDDRAGRSRFLALDPGDAAGEALATADATSERTAGCAAAEATGEARLIHRVAQVRGPGWFVEAGEWQVEEVVALGPAGACARSITGGEARDEREAGAGREEHEPVRSFVLRATGADTFEGRAWSGRRAIALRCRME